VKQNISGCSDLSVLITDRRQWKKLTALCTCDEERIYEEDGLILILTNTQLVFLCIVISFTTLEPATKIMITLYSNNMLFNH